MFISGLLPLLKNTACLSFLSIESFTREGIHSSNRSMGKRCWIVLQFHDWIITIIRQNLFKMVYRVFLQLSLTKVLSSRLAVISGDKLNPLSLLFATHHFSLASRTPTRPVTTHSRQMAITIVVLFLFVLSLLLFFSSQPSSMGSSCQYLRSQTVLLVKMYCAWILGGFIVL